MDYFRIGRTMRRVTCYKNELKLLFDFTSGGLSCVIMAQGYSPFKIAKFFIDKAISVNGDLTPMKLIKIVYIAHGWSLALLHRPLISEAVQAWKYGPVIESLYHAFKHKGNSSIRQEDAAYFPCADDIDQQTEILLEKVWDRYGKLSGLDLSALTHQPGTPWYTVWEGGGKNTKCAEIPDSTISEFYSDKLTTRTGSGH